MIRIVIIAVHPQESQILQMAFRQRSYAVYASEPVAGNYLQMLQYRPDFVLIEIPPNYQDQIALMRLLGKNERFSKTPVIAYGSSDDVTMKNDISAAGSKYYTQRPLKLNHLFEAMKKTAPEKDLEGDAQRAKKTRAEEKLGDLQRLLDPKEEIRVKIDLMVKHTGKLMSFPFAIAKILEIADDPNRGAEDLAKVINGDLSLCTTILKVSNSVHFAARNTEIRSAKEAIMRIGFSEVKTIAIGLELMNLFPDNETFGFNRMDFWTYALGRALITEKLARHVRYADPAFAFLAGLLSDFSVLLLDAFFPNVFNAVLQKISTENKSYSKASIEVLGFQPMEFVVRLLEMWRLPADLVDALRLQYKLFERKEEAAPNPVRLLADCVAISGVLARTGEIGHGCDDVINLIPDGFLREIHLPAGVSISFYESAYTALQVYGTFFGLESRFLPQLPVDPATLPPMLYIRLGKRLFDPYSLYFSRQFKLTIVRSSAEALNALASGSFRIAVLQIIPATPLEDVPEILDAIAKSQNSEGKQLTLLGLAHTEETPTIPEGMRVAFSPVHGDMRKVLQSFEILLI